MKHSKNLFQSGWFVFCLFAFTLIACSNEGLFAAKSASEEPNWQHQVDDLNEKITLLKRWQEGYRMTAEQAQFKADRLQFEEKNLIDAKQLWKVAENANQKAQDLQVIIDKLEEQRNEILKRHHQPIPKN